MTRPAARHPADRPGPVRSLAAVLACAVAVMGAVPATAHGQIFSLPGGGDLPKPFARYSDAARALRDSMTAPRSGETAVALARTALGTRYRLGASAPGRAFDCSGFVQWVMSAFDVELPRTSREQARVGEPLPRDTTALLPGDVLTFGTKERISHVGIYVGEGRYIHASSARRGVVESPLARDVSRGWWRGARRVLAPAESLATLPPGSSPR